MIAFALSVGSFLFLALLASATIGVVITERLSNEDVAMLIFTVVWLVLSVLAAVAAAALTL